ncbi:acyl-CoA thioesterase [Simiduia aestuariiviva]|uniref:Acyl-CoA thioester hydrolase n=1 Tax=Simiduia aestuariiviva TaxID=1510459 RepID=A0A839UQ88_9GAMM|nr:thioesterase family protein [Simiduia aestuariiviva]MBB3168670.1 acyl-CoA thioester hydrolase [Simiduia aestuariiviva]
MSKLFEKVIAPRFSETDALGHVSNTTLPVWFEDARQPVFELFTPTLDVNNWPLILARFEVDFTAQLFYGKDVLIKTGLSRLGNSSLEVYQEAWQADILAAKGRTTLVHFDYTTQKAKPIDDLLRQQLTNYLVSPV